jgi:DNA-directed RNA polymerase subunit M/transcription elongation factor TFIIS
MDEQEEIARRDLSRTLLTRKVQEEEWNVSRSVMDQWILKVNLHMAHYRSFSVVQFQLEELIHYLTLDQLQNIIIPANSEQQCVIDMYKTMETEVEVPTHQLLQDPEVTFGEKIKSPPCRKCKATNIATIPIQTRSSDEPTSYYYQCRQCNHRWKDK